MGNSNSWFLILTCSSLPIPQNRIRLIRPCVTSGYSQN